MNAPGLPRILTDRYRLERLLGEGGMATVFLATDRKHQRPVALKMMRGALGSALGAERFLREIAVTAQLDHPHVVPLLDSGAVDDELFYVMPYVEGESLRDRLTREKQLSLDTALSIADNVLDALEYAHARGVIHRDIKPENILLSGGHARVADFGIARAVAASAGETLTGTGVALGTPAYMSPEQASADRDVDRRSDLYAVGCVLYEMLAGQPPFVGPTSESLVRQHMVAPPQPVTQLRPSVPAGVAAVIDRALAKAPADRYESAAAFADALTEAARVGAAAPVAPPQAVATLASPPRRRAIALLLGVLITVFAAIGIRWMLQRPTAPAERPLVAVLPFKNLGGPDEEYFADGVTTEITTKLARISGIGVISRQTAMRYRGSTLSLREIARELGVQYLLVGSVRTERLADGTGRVRVTPELVRATDDTQLWTDGLTVPLAIGEVFDVQSRIAESVADAFNVTLLQPEVEALRRRETENLAAYEAYQLGRFQAAKGAPDAVREAIGHFERAMALDSKYARPHADMAGAYLLIPQFPASWLPQTEVFERAEAAARLALELDPELAVAHSALGEVLAMGYWRWTDAEAEQRRAIALDPGSAEAHLRLSAVLGLLGKREEALRAAEMALALEPTSPQTRRGLAVALAASGRVDDAVRQLQEALRLEPGYALARVQLAEMAAARGDLAGMGAELGKLRGLEQIGALFTAWAAGRGQRSDLVSAVASIRSPNAGLDYVRKAWLFANAGEPARALEALEAAVAMHVPTSPALFRFPTVVKALGGDARFQALAARTGVRIDAAR